MIDFQTAVQNQFQTLGIYSDDIANRPAPGIPFRFFNSLDEKKIYVDNGTAWVLFIDGTNSPPGGPFLPLSAGAGFPLTGELFSQDIQATKTAPGAASAIVGITPGPTGTVTAILNLIAQNNVDGGQNTYIFQGVTPVNGPVNNTVVISMRGASGSMAYLSDIPAVVGVYLPLAAGSGNPLTGILFAPLGINANGNFTVDTGGNISAIAISVNNVNTSGLTSTNATINTLLQALAISGIGAGGTLTLQPNTAATPVNSAVMDNNGITYGGGVSVAGRAFLDRRTLVDPATGIVGVQVLDSISAVAANNANGFVGGGFTLQVAATSTKNFTAATPFQGIGGTVSILNGAGGVIAKVVGGAAQIANGSAGMTVTQAIGFIANALASLVGVTTNAVHLLLGTSTPPSGNFNIYYPGSLPSQIGGTVTVDVLDSNGAVNATNDVVSNFGNLAALGGSVAINSTKTVVGTGGNGLTLAQPFGVAAYGAGSFNEVLIYVDAYNGTHTFTFANAFTHTPNISGDAAVTALVSGLTVSGFTITGVGAATGWIFFKGF